MDRKSPVPRFRALKHSLILVSVPDPYPNPGSFVCHLHFANEETLVENGGERKAGLKRPVCFLFYCLLWGTREPNQGAAGDVRERGGVRARDELLEYSRTSG